VRLEIYNTPAIPTSLYGSENWTTKVRDKIRVTAAEIIFVRRTAKCSRMG